ncbi:MAG: radical SAM protein, partial [Candidatus Pacebacteria bacterium]|nr:radical SAM protein [Candidatus Paceibacterota bacterium]
TIPFLYNCSGYERAELISDVADLFHIFMPDVKFASPDLAAMCMNAPDYPEVAMAALEQMVATRGFLEPFDVTGTRTAREGVLVRHLVLPGHADDSIRLLRQLRDRFGRMLPLSVLSQYKPMPECTRRGQLTRQVTADDYQRVCNTLHELDFQQVFIQNLDGESEFLPDFQRKTPFPGNRQ